MASLYVHIKDGGLYIYLEPQFQSYNNFKVGEKRTIENINVTKNLDFELQMKNKYLRPLPWTKGKSNIKRLLLKLSF